MQVLLASEATDPSDEPGRAKDPNDSEKRNAPASRPRAAKAGQQPDTGEQDPGRIDRETLRYDGKSFREWQTILRTELKSERRVEGLKAMGIFGVKGYGKEAAQMIIEITQDYEAPSSVDADVIIQAIESLQRIGPPAVPALIDGLKGQSRNTRRFVAWLLSEFDVPSYWSEARLAVPSLVSVAKMQSEDPRVRTYAIRALATTRPHEHEVVLSLVSLLDDRNPEIRREVVAKLPEDNRHRAVIFSALTKGLKDDDRTVRSLAAERIGQIGPSAESSVSALLELVKDEDRYVRRAAIAALGAVKAKPEVVVPVLVEALKDEYQNVDEDTRDAALELLGKLGPQAKDAVPAIIDVFPKGSAHIRIRVVTALGSIGPEAKAAIPVLTEAARRDEDGECQKAATAALRKISK
jgi:HEAT repeat protein